MKNLDFAHPSSIENSKEQKIRERLGMVVQAFSPAFGKQSQEDIPEFKGQSAHLHSEHPDRQTTWKRDCFKTKPKQKQKQKP